MKIYCRKCGNPTEYSANYPSFCSNCGKPLNASAARMGKPSKPEPEEDEPEEKDMPSISKLDMDIELYKTNLSIGDIAGSKSEGLGRGEPNEKERKALMDDFFREAGAKEKPKDI